MERRTPRMLLLQYLESIQERPVYTDLDPAYPDPLSTKELSQVQLTVFNGKYKEISTGHNKREAKQEAAKKILIKLAQDRPDLKSFLEANDFDAMMERSYAVKTDKNVLEKLNALCLLNNLGICFILTKEIGEPHNKQYTIRCEVDNLKVEATRKTMKGAKNACANKMIELIEERKKIKTMIPKDFKVTYENKSEVKEEMDLVKKILQSKTINPTKASGVKLAKLHLLETDPDCNVINILNAVKRDKNYDHDMFCRYLDYASMHEVKPIIQRLQREAGVDIRVTIQELPIPNKLKELPLHIVFVRFYYQNVSKSFCTVGPHQLECERTAYGNLLKYLSDLRMNTTGVSVMLDNETSDED